MNVPTPFTLSSVLVFGQESSSVHAYDLLTKIAAKDALLNSHWGLLHFFKYITDFLP